MRTLADDVPAFEFYKDMFPTTEMKVTLASFYIHTLDLLWRLAKYFSLGFLSQLGDALFPRQKYTFTKYLSPIKSSAIRLKNLCDAGHVAEQRSIKKLVESTDSEVKELHIEIRTLLHLHAQELQSLNLHIEKLESNNRVSYYADARRNVSSLLDIWNDEIGEIEHELQRWQKVRFSTAQRDHWTTNGILPCILKWRQLTSNSILWICSESEGRQSWMTEFSLDLIRVCQNQGQMITFALCDRPKGVKWTPQILIKHIISQLLHLNPTLSSEEAEVFDPRAFRRAKTFQSTMRLLTAIFSRLDTVLLIIDRLDLCTRDLDAPEDQNMAHIFSKLVNAFPKTLKIVITTNQIVDAKSLPGLPISFATINTRRRPRRRYEDAERAADLRLLARYKRGLNVPKSDVLRLKKKGLIPRHRSERVVEDSGSVVDD